MTRKPTPPARRCETIQDIVNLALNAANRGAEWLLQRLQPNGSLEGGQYLNAYYKLPFALAATGHLAECERVFDHIADRFFTGEGDLDGEGIPWFDQFRIYPHAWLAFTAGLRGRWEFARPLMGFLEEQHNATSGGFTTRQDGSEEIMTTCMAGLAAVANGRIDLAVSAAGWLHNVWLAQPHHSKGLYHVWQPGQGLVTQFPEDRAPWYLVDATKLRQWYYQYGISAAFLSQLAAHSGETHWLDLGRQILHGSKLCREDVYRTPQAGKIGWGAAWMYRVGKDAADAAIAREVVDGIIALQQPDGSWADTAYDQHTTIDVTAEMTGLLAAMGVVLHD